MLKTFRCNASEESVYDFVDTSKNFVVAFFQHIAGKHFKIKYLSNFIGLQKTCISGDNPFKRVNGRLKVKQLVATALFL